jgi:hypothetical protein
MVKIKHKGIRTTVKTIVGYKARWMKTDEAKSRLTGVGDVVMNSTDMAMIDLQIIHRLQQAWTTQQYRPLRELSKEEDILEQAGIFKDSNLYKEDQAHKLNQSGE